ncbi:hypothetical protein Taro_030069 [Colocasia esculenta]|uniref:Uncharacterized protein n=1 Tax=Colocasia esculenta TaxID=4460 RepID=A0A843VT17_COLES|nr:hypothetical protein [Colocasia esculenta]
MEGVTDRLFSKAWSVEGSVVWFPTDVFSVSGRLGARRACGVVDIYLCALHHCCAPCELSDVWFGTPFVASFSGRAVCADIGRRPFWRLFLEGVPCVPMPAGLVLVTSQLCCFCGGCYASSLFSGARHLRDCLRDRLLPFRGTPSPVLLLREFSRRRACSSLGLGAEGENGGDSSIESLVEIP